VNDGVEESPPSKPSLNGSSSAAAGPDPNELFVNLSGANVGFKHWHPMPVTQNGGKLAGQGDMGGLWEWTSSTLEKQDGFEPMQLYPAYSSKFRKASRDLVIFMLTCEIYQPTSMMISTTSCSVDLGRLIRAWPVARHCKFTKHARLKCNRLLTSRKVSTGTSGITYMSGPEPDW
jgi:hypothetical protein